MWSIIRLTVRLMRRKRWDALFEVEEMLTDADGTRHT
jgi:hypothetical protein